MYCGQRSNQNQRISIALVICSRRKMSRPYFYICIFSIVICEVSVPPNNEPIQELADSIVTDIKNNDKAVSPEPKTPQQEAPKLAKKPALFNVFKKKNEPAPPTLEGNAETCAVNDVFGWVQQAHLYVF